jgi:hypothetical protein
MELFLERSYLLALHLSRVDTNYNSSNHWIQIDICFYILHLAHSTRFRSQRCHFPIGRRHSVPSMGQKGRLFLIGSIARECKHLILV